MKAVVIILGLVAIGGSWLGYSRLAGGGDDDQYVMHVLDRGDIVQTVSATGTIEPLVKVIVGSQVSGVIEKWYADFNDEVTAGFVLAEIDPDRFRTALAQAKADLALARAREEELRVRYNDAERERKRIQALHERSIASENELLVVQADSDAAKAALRGAAASVQSAEAGVNAAEVDLEYTVIRSPIDGIVIARNFDVGQTVAASFQAPELFLIANDLKQMRVDADVSESDVGLIAEGMPASFRVDAYPGRSFVGTVSQIRYNANVVDGVVTYVTLIDVVNDDLALRPGMTANVTFEVAKAEGVLRIPTAALRFNPAPPGAASMQRKKGGARRRPTVWVLEGGEPEPREIEIALSDGRFAAMVKGDLSEGTAVITELNYLGGSGRRPDVTRSLRRGRSR